jgi:hypothetical protein
MGRIRTGRLTYGLVVFLFAFLAGSAEASWISLGGPEGQEAEVNVLESSRDRIVVEFVLPGFYAEPLEIEGQTYYAITLPGEPLLLEKGKPSLPHLCRSVIVPDEARMELNVLEKEIDTFQGMPVRPSKGNLLRTVDPATIPYEFDPIYQEDVWFPAEDARLGEPYILRDYRGQVVDALPFQANGQRQELRVLRRLVVELVAVGPDTRNVIRRDAPPTRIVSDFRQIYAHHFLNWGMDRYTPVDEVGSMLVITYDGFHDAMLPFVEWKNQMGLPTTMVDVSTIGNDPTSIKNYIQNVYDASDLAYVLIVGDAQQVSTPYYAGGASDPSYSLLAGTDLYPEIFVGRFSAETLNHVETQVTRSVTYEQTPMAGADWYAKGAGIASNQGPGDDNEYDYEHIDIIRDKLLAYGYTLVDQIYDPYATDQMVADALNEGRSIVNYCGHGSTTGWGTSGFNISDVYNLQNDWMLPFILSVACVNGQFNNTTCFAEAWLRATRNGNPIGAVGTYMSSINQYWDPPMCAQDEANDLLVNEEMFTMGGLFFNGSCQMMDEYGPAEGGDMFMTWHIFGDPSLLVRTRIPDPMTVQHDGVLFIGMTEYPVSVPGVEGARCALYGDGILYGVAFTDAAGQAVIPLDPAPENPTTLTLTVTAPNKIPAIEDVEVLPPSGPFLVVDHSVVDDTQGGDGDGACGAGETVDLTVVLGNVGVEPATGVSATLSSEDPYVEVLVDYQTYDDVPAGGTAASHAPYVVSFSPDTPDGHVAALQLAIQANEGSWDQVLSLAVNAPKLLCAGVDLDDSEPLGNGSGWIGVGETFAAVLTLSNEGHAGAYEVEAQIIGLNPHLEVIEGNASCPEVPAGGQADLTPFVLRIRESCPSPTMLYVQVAFHAQFGYDGIGTFPIPVGGFLDDAETDLGWTLGAPDDDATTGQWVREDPVGTTYNGHVVQPEDDHTPRGTICFVTGNGSPGGSAGEADVDGGKTTLLSPVFDLQNVADATLEYYVWYTNDLGNNPGEDVWLVQATGDGTNWVDLENTTQSTNDWAFRSFDLNAYLSLTDQVQFRFVASDEGGGSLVEALVDDIVLRVLEPSADVAAGSAWPATFRLRRPYPNPGSGSVRVRFSVPVACAVDLRVYDVSGRLVRTLASGVLEAGEHRITWDGRTDSGERAGSGVYFLRFRAPGFEEVREITLLR